MRDLQAAEKDGDQRASLAIRLFVKNIVRYIGQYYVEMGGLDAIVLLLELAKMKEQSGNGSSTAFRLWG